MGICMCKSLFSAWLPVAASGRYNANLLIVIVPVIGQTTPDIDGTKSKSVGISIVFLLFLFIFFYKPSWGATTWIWTSEIFR